MMKQERNNINEWNSLIEINENIKREKEIQEYKNNMQIIFDQLIEKLEYKKWIILWDLNNKDYYHISSDIRKNKINLNDVIDVIRKSNNIRNIFDESNIIELIKGI